MKKFLILLPIAFLSLQSCQDVINIELDEGEKRIIINGRITDTLPVEVSIYTTADYLSTDPNPRVGGAVVNLYENDILVATLRENDTTSGIYEDAFIGTEGNTYHVEVLIPEGHQYFPGTRWLSNAETMNRITPADSNYSKFQPSQPFIEEGYYAYVMFTEPTGKGDNYRQRLWKNDTLNDTQFDLNFFNDDFIDGRSFDDIDLPAVQISGASKVGDIYKVELSSITSEGYRFLELLQQQTVQVGSTFDPPPAPIFGNIVNADDPSRLGLGYFFASKLTYTTIEIIE